eukprot:jgi/Ulvmu1/7012/UM033_0071.1
MFPELCTHGPAAGLDSSAFDWLTHSIIGGVHIDTLAAAANHFSEFCRQPLPITHAQEQLAMESEVELELTLQAERVQSVPVHGIAKPRTGHETSVGQPHFQASHLTTPGSTALPPLQTAHVLPASVTPFCPPVSSLHAVASDHRGAPMESNRGPSQGLPMRSKYAPQQTLTGLTGYSAGLPKGAATTAVDGDSDIDDDDLLRICETVEAALQTGAEVGSACRLSVPVRVDPAHTHGREKRHGEQFPENVDAVVTASKAAHGDLQHQAVDESPAGLMCLQSIPAAVSPGDHHTPCALRSLAEPAAAPRGFEAVSAEFLADMLGQDVEALCNVVLDDSGEGRMEEDTAEHEAAADTEEQRTPGVQPQQEHMQHAVLDGTQEHNGNERVHTVETVTAQAAAIGSPVDVALTCSPDNFALASTGALQASPAADMAATIDATVASPAAFEVPELWQQAEPMVEAEELDAAGAGSMEACAADGGDDMASGTQDEPFRLPLEDTVDAHGSPEAAVAEVMQACVDGILQAAVGQPGDGVVSNANDFPHASDPAGHVPSGQPAASQVNEGCEPVHCKPKWDTLRLRDLVSKAIRTKEPAQAPMSSIVDRLWVRVAGLHLGQPYRVVEDVIKDSIEQNQNAGLVASAVRWLIALVFLANEVNCREQRDDQTQDVRPRICGSIHFLKRSDTEPLNGINLYMLLSH